MATNIRLLLPIVELVSDFFPSGIIEASMTKQSKISAESSVASWRDTLPPIPLTPDENKEQFETLLQAVTADLEPHGPYEHILAQNIFELEWERWRLRRWRESVLRAGARLSLANTLHAHQIRVADASIEEAALINKQERMLQFQLDRLDFEESEIVSLVDRWTHGTPEHVLAARSVIHGNQMSEEEPLAGGYSENLPMLNHMERALSQLEIRRRRLLADYLAYKKSRAKSIEDAEFLDIG